MRRTHFPANQSQFQLQVAGLAAGTFSLQRFHSEDMQLSSHYRYAVECLAAYELDVQILAGQHAKLVIAWPPEQLFVHGVIARCTYSGPTDGGNQHRYHLTLASPLDNLAVRQTARVFVNQSVTAIVKDVLLTAQWPAHAFRFNTARTCPPRELVMQLNETDLSFIERLLA